MRDLERGGGTRLRTHNHYLKGSLWCARCKGRFYYVPGHSHTGAVHFYYMCAGRHRHTCDLPYLHVEAVERAVEDNYTSVTLSPDLREKITAAMRAAVSDTKTMDRRMRAQFVKQLTALEEREDQYFELVGNPAWPAAKLTAKMNEIREDKVRIQAQLEGLTAPKLDEGRSALTTLLELLGDATRLYRTSGEAGHKVLNQAFFTAPISTK